MQLIGHWNHYPVCSCCWCRIWIQNASSDNKPQVTLSNRFQLENGAAQESTSSIQSIRSSVWTVPYFRDRIQSRLRLQPTESVLNHSGYAVGNNKSSSPLGAFWFDSVTREESIFEFPPEPGIYSSSAEKCRWHQLFHLVSSIPVVLVGLDTTWRLFQSIFTNNKWLNRTLKPLIPLSSPHSQEYIPQDASSSLLISALDNSEMTWNDYF